MIEQRDYAHIPTYVYKADAAADVTTATPKSASFTWVPSPKPRPEDRDKIQPKLELATALAHLGQGHYEKAAISFLKIGPIKKLGDWIGKVCSFQFTLHFFNYMSLE
jgi:COP9 signalosome complex subunit 1